MAALGLPAPKLDGTRATCVNAVPGADVVVEATRTGFEQFVEIEERPAEGCPNASTYLAAARNSPEQQPDWVTCDLFGPQRAAPTG